jgi:hypothetical protein
LLLRKPCASPLAALLHVASSQGLDSTLQRLFLRVFMCADLALSEQRWAWFVPSLGELGLCKTKIPSFVWSSPIYPQPFPEIAKATRSSPSSRRYMAG